MSYALIAYYVGDSVILCPNCARDAIKNAGIETDEEANYILNGPDYNTNNEMERWPLRYQRNTKLHEKGEYKRDKKGEILFNEEYTKITKQNRPSNFANIWDREDIYAIWDYEEHLDGVYCDDCHEELDEPYKFECRICSEAIATGEEGLEYEREIDKKFTKVVDGEEVPDYRAAMEHYICEDCMQKMQKESYQSFVQGVYAIANRERWAWNNDTNRGATRTSKWNYIIKLINACTTLSDLKELLLKETKEAVTHAWQKEQYWMGEGLYYNATYHADLLNMLEQHIEHEVDFDIAWNGVARQ